MKKRNIILAVLTLALLSARCNNPVMEALDKLTGKEKTDVDLSQAIWLLPEYVPPGDAGAAGDAGASGNTGSTGTTPPVHDLFALPPGSTADAKAFAGIIDPTGTSIVNDYDGDGILNENETASNIWAADYPVIETSIAAPVTMKIAILVDKNGETSELVSEITSDDYQNNNVKGDESVHRQEVQERTEQIENSYGASSSSQGSVSKEVKTERNGKVGIMGLSLGGGGSQGKSGGLSWGSGASFQQTVTSWVTRPFKNNLDSSSWSVKSDSSAKKARQFRNDRRSKTNTTSIIKPDAGYVRAALYVKNLSVNMPVHLSNILCSLMFENVRGELIPVQSFRLRNNDYSLFEVDVYGDSEFGPYVIELTGLNTAEIEKAIQLGYNPKIFVVSYDMTHVQDSNYRSSLLHYSGDNLKIVEENAKGRTALVKIMGPQMRRMFRVAAFGTVPAAGQTGGVCKETRADSFSVGIPLRTALKRIACSDVNVQYGYYVIDLADELPGLTEGRVFLPAVKSIGGVANSVPCAEVLSHTDADGTQNVCVQKPFEQWTDAEKNAFGMWVIFADGRLYVNSEYDLAGSGAVRQFATTGGSVPMVKGIDSKIWAGDQFELVYVTYNDLVSAQRVHGANPLETAEVMPFNTRWDKGMTGNYPFDPNIKSVFLGKAGLGDFIEITFQLKDTTYLDYAFGDDKETVNPLMRFDDFRSTFVTYRPADATRLFSLPEAIDFEISMGLGGTPGDWFNILRDVNPVPPPDAPPANPEKPTNCGQSLDFMKQTYTVCVQLPLEHVYVAPDAVVNVYLRTGLNSAYRNTIWPAPYLKVKKFQGKQALAAKAGATQITVTEATGALDNGDALVIAGETGLTVAASVQETNGDYTVTLSGPLAADHASGEAVTVAGVPLGSSEVNIEIGDSFFTEWNAGIAYDANNWANPQKLWLFTGAISNYTTCLDYNGNPATPSGFNPMKCLGFPQINWIVANWAGNNNLENPKNNAFTDGGGYLTFLDTLSQPFLTTSGSGNVRINLLVNPPTYGINTFFKAPLIERNFDVQSRILK